MKKLKFRDDPAALARLAEAQNALDEYSKAHRDEFGTEKNKEHGRELFRERAAALSEATGMKIYSIFD